MITRFEVYRSQDGDWRYKFVAADDQVILQSEAYRALTNCIKGVESCREHSPYDRFYSRSDDTSGFTFHLKASNNRAVGQGPKCASAEEREKIIDTVKRYASTAQTMDIKKEIARNR